MPTWLATLISDILWKLMQHLWSALDESRKAFLASELIKKHVEAKAREMSEHFKRIDERIDQLKVQGKVLTKEEKDEIRKERIKLETDLWNTRS